MRQPDEPSIEEILDSIKQVIAREDRSAGLRSVVASRGDDTGDLAADDDVLELSQASQVPPHEAEPAPLLTEDTSRSLRGSLDTLADVVGTEPRTDAPAGETSTLEALLRDLLRPALSDWLDRNLPTIVERMVAVEIARITGRR
jgi:cell pole-organizing protein PopZ